MPENRLAEYLDSLDEMAERYGYTATLKDYDTMRVAYGRGLVSDGELSRWLRWYEYASDTAYGWKGWLRFTIGKNIGVTQHV